MGDDRSGIELVSGQETSHLMPRLVHAASDDAADRDAFEDDLIGEVHRDLAFRDAQELHPAAQADGLKGLMQRGGHARHLTHHVHTFAPRLGAYHLQDVLAARAIPTAKQPIGPHPTMNTVLPGISAVSTV